MWRKLLCGALIVLVGNAWASDEAIVDKAWLRESVPGQKSASLQLNLTVTKSANLIGVSSAAATEVQIQRLLPSHGKMNVRVVPKVHLSRNRALAFGEHSFALMLTGLKTPLKVGDQVPVTLTLEFSDKHVRIVETVAEVRALALSYKHYGGHEVHDNQ